MNQMADLHYYIDWNNTGLFDHDCSDITAYVMQSSWRFGRNAAHEYDSAGTASLTLDNSSSVFSSFNAASPIYGKILPNIRVRITMDSSGITTTMFQGFLESIVPTVGLAPRARLNTAELVAYGVLAQFNDGTVSVPLQKNIDAGAALAAMLDADGYSVTERSIQAGLTTISKWWAKPDSSRIKVMRELQSAEFGRLREGKDGNLCFENRANPFTAPRNAPQAVYGTGSLRIWNLRQENPLLGVFNRIESEIHTFNVSEDIVLVTIADVPGNQGGVPPVVPGNGSLTIDIDYPTASGPGNYIAVDSWGMVDYEANTVADRTGADITRDVSATKTEKGSRLTVVFANANPQPAHLVVLRARGVAIVEGDPIPVSSEDAASRTKYRKREYPYPSPWLTYLPDGQKYCDYIVSAYKDLRPRLTFDVKGDYDANHLDEARRRDIGDRIRVVASLADYGLAIDAEFIVDSLSYSVDAAGLITMTVSCTQAPVSQLGPLATPYDPKTIPDGDGEPHVPDDPFTNAICNGPSVRVGCEWRKWNADIFEAELRAKCFPLGTNLASADLRTREEGGDLEHNGVDQVVIEGLPANWQGRNFTLEGLASGRWYYAWRAKNQSGWSVWSDGNDVPQYVTDHADTGDSTASDTGPAEDWSVKVEAGPQPDTAFVTATRPRTNGHTIVFAFAQIKDARSEEFVPFDTDISAALGDLHVAFDASEEGVRFNPSLGVLESARGWGDAQAGDLLLVDIRNFRGGNASGQSVYMQVFNRIRSGTQSLFSPELTGKYGSSGFIEHGHRASAWSAFVDRYVSGSVSASPGTGVWALPHCMWGTIDSMDGTRIFRFYGTGNIQAPAGGWIEDVRLKIIHGPWSWNRHGYFGDLASHGWVGHPIYGEPYLIPGGDTTTQSFRFGPMPYPADLQIGDIKGRVVFCNGYGSFNDDGAWSEFGSGSFSETGIDPADLVPGGGTAGQVLTKVSGEDNDVEWADQAGGSVPGLPEGGDAGDVLVKSSEQDYDAAWAPIPVIPPGGSAGQVLKKSSGADYDCAWNNDGTGTSGSSIILTDIYANRPSPGSAGRLFLPTDSVFIERDDGSAWKSFGPVFPMTPPLVANFSWINQGGASVDASRGGLYLACPWSNGDNLRMLARPAPPTPYNVDVCLYGGWLQGVTYYSAGIVLRKSSDGKLVTWGIGQDLNYAVSYWNSQTSWNSTPTNVSIQSAKALIGYGPHWLRVRDDGTNYIFYFSSDALTWIAWMSISRTTFAVADQIGMFVNVNRNNGATGYAWFLHFLPQS